MSEQDLTPAGAPDYNETQAAIDAGTALADPKPLDPIGSPVTVVVPAGGKLTVVDPEKFAPVPRRATGIYRPATVDALVAVVKRHQNADETTVWVHPDNGRVVAVFNDNNAKSAAWRDHRAVLELLVTDEWSFWLKKDGSLMNQIEFAEHVEEGLTEIAEPPGADMLELAQSIQATQGATFRSAIRLNDGNIQAQYDETIDATAGKSSQMTIPTEFKLAIAPFTGEDPYSIVAKLRYRLSGGRLSIGYKLVRPNDVKRDALDKIAEKLAGEFPAVYVGQPEGN